MKQIPSIVTINQDSFSTYFEKPFKECLSGNEKNVIDEIKENINFTNEYKDTEYYKYIEKHFIKEVEDKQVFCIILLLPFLSKNFVRKSYIEIYKKRIPGTSDFPNDKTLIQTKNKKIVEAYLLFLKNQLAKAKEIFNGIYELAKNIVEHSGTEDKKGSGTIVINPAAI